MADDRHDRRVGDATQARIDDMAEGWKKPAKAPPAPKEKPAGAKKPPSAPPPLPPSASKPAARPPVPAKSQAAAAPSRPVTRHTIKRAPKAPTPPLPRPKVESAPPPPPASAQRAEGSPLPVPVPPEIEFDSVASGSIVSEPDDRDATKIPTGDELSLADLRAPAALPRRSGIWGDMLYVGTVIAGRRRLKIELAETELEIEAEKRSRDKELTEFARLAISDPNVTTKAIEEARQQLVALEEARSRKAGAAVAAEQAIEAILRERDKVKDEREQTIVTLETQIADLEAKLAPLEKRRVEIGRRAREVIEQVERYQARIEACQSEASGASGADVSVEAEATIAGLRAELEVAERRQPALASELAEVEPPIRELKAEKGELAKRISKLRRAEDESVVRSDEKVTAARAHKLVVDRAAADRTREQNELLRDVGEALYRVAPDPVAHLAKPIVDRVSTLERLKARAVTAKEKLQSIERWPLVRGLALWLGVLAIAGAIAFGVYKLVG